MLHKRSQSAWNFRFYIHVGIGSQCLYGGRVHIQWIWEYLRMWTASINYTSYRDIDLRKGNLSIRCGSEVVCRQGAGGMGGG